VEVAAIEGVRDDGVVPAGAAGWLVKGSDGADRLAGLLCDHVADLLVGEEVGGGGYLARSRHGRCAPCSITVGGAPCSITVEDGDTTAPDGGVAGEPGSPRQPHRSDGLWR
jgi:hypothetical protein